MGGGKREAGANWEISIDTYTLPCVKQASLVAQMVKNLPAVSLDGRPGFNPWVGKMPWRRAQQPTPVFLPGESPWTVEPGGLQSMGEQRV